MRFLKEYLGVIVTAIALVSIGAGAVIWVLSNTATPASVDRIKIEVQADISNLRSEVQVVRLQTEDALDARIAFLNKEIGRIEAKRAQGDLSPTDIQYLIDLNREADRLRLLRYGKDARGSSH